MWLICDLYVTYMWSVVGLNKLKGDVDDELGWVGVATVAAFYVLSIRYS